MTDELDQLDAPTEYPIIEFGYEDQVFDNFLWGDEENEASPEKSHFQTLDFLV